MSRSSPITAKWIWKRGADVRAYNQTIVARKGFVLGEAGRATLRITADSWYRVFINGQWVNDGPCRSWPEHYQYDVIDAGPYLRAGQNRIEVIARYFGTGTFQQHPQQAGLLVQLDVRLRGGGSRTIISDGSWLVAQAEAFVSRVPKIAGQLGELYDATLASGARFDRAAVLFDAQDGPWKDLHPRDVALLTKVPFALKSFMAARIVERSRDIHWCVDTYRLLYPGVVEAAINISGASGMATVLRLAKPTSLKMRTVGYRVHIDGRAGKDGLFKLSAGPHMVVAWVDPMFSQGKEMVIDFVAPPAMTLKNPLDPHCENPWCWIDLPECRYADNDLTWLHDPPRKQFLQRYGEMTDRLTRQGRDHKSFIRHLGPRCRIVSSQRMFLEDPYWLFLHRRPVGDAGALVHDPAALMGDDPACTTVLPSAKGDIELMYDLGEQNCGYWRFDLSADAGVAVDINALEHIFEDGTLWHTGYARNAMRYVTRRGRNVYTSIRRRSGRYIFITLRNVHSPVRIRKFELVESTYPARRIGGFECSDERLTRIFDISARTLKLCMEDTYVDCPLYEQTLWVGDARNEAIFGLELFAADDMARRCIRLTGQTPQRLGVVGCQVPSSWDCILPAWSFLWGLSVWDYYFHSGDKPFLRECWPWVVRNLRGAQGMLNDRGLFSGNYWNLLEWADIDYDHATVLHNSMVMVCAIDAALSCAKVLGEPADARWLSRMRRDLVKSVNATWDAKRKAYPDSIHEDGKPSPRSCVHTSMLAILYDIVEPRRAKQALRNVLSPAAGTAGFGTPFGMELLYEMLDKVGRPEGIVPSIYQNYLPMLAVGATTVWEIFPRKGVPTRSHCHAWSAAPIHFLPRVVLGIRQTAPAGAAYKISPLLSGLSWASGAISTAKGRLDVRWRRVGGVLRVSIDAPRGAKVKFVRNASHKGLAVRMESHG